jgi:hypothetical protein
VTTRNNLDPTTSSILLAKRLALPSALNSPINLNNPKQLRRQAQQTRIGRMTVKRHIGNREDRSGP